MIHTDIREEQNSQCKGSEARLFLASYRKTQQINMFGANGEENIMGNEVKR